MCGETCLVMKCELPPKAAPNRDPLGGAGGGAGEADHLVDRGTRDGLVAGAARKEIRDLRATRLPIEAQGLEEARAEHDVAILGALEI